MPAFPFSSANVILEPIVVSNDEFEALDAQFENELFGSAVNVQPVNFSNDHYEDGWLSVGQIAHLTFQLQDIQSSHVNLLAASMRALAFDHSSGMRTVTWSAKCNPTDSAIKYAVGVQQS